MTTSDAAGSKKFGEPGYGIDEPRSIIELVLAGALAVAVGFVVSAYSIGSNPSLARLGLLVGPAVGFLILAVATALYWSSRQGKPSEMSRIVSDIPWGGNEVVLDLGCGRGLGMILAAKRLESGLAVGLDVWQKRHISGNDPLSIWENAKRESVKGKVCAIKGDPRYLPIRPSKVDVLLSATSMHKLVKKKDRAAVFGEISRVSKDGGRVGILDAGNGPAYSKLLYDVGMTDVSIHRLRFSSFPPFHVVLARKPFSG